MKTHRLAQTDLAVSRIGYGCASLGTWDNASIDADAVCKADRLIKTAHQHGITLFDHADLYAFGKSEALFGEVLTRSPGLRDQLVLQSKCGQFFPAGWAPGKPIGVDLSSEHIITAVEGSLKRLATTHLDILLLHAPDALTPDEEIASAFDQLKASGKVRYFGVSNFTGAQIARLKKSVAQPLIVNQIHISLGAPASIADGLDFTLSLAKGSASAVSTSHTGTLDYCRLHDIQVQAWSPLSGEILKAPKQADPKFKPTVEKLVELARNKNTTPAVVALAWVLRHPANIVPIIGPTNSTHIEENCEAAEVTLSPEQWYALLATASDLR